MTDSRRFAPATQRNRDAILNVLRGALPQSGVVLEIASGTGEHAVHFAQALPQLEWQPTDPSAQSRESIAGWISESGVQNIKPPLELDASAEDWPLQRADAIVCINMVHISPWEATEGLMRGAGHLLPDNGLLYLYGPYRRANHPFEPSNAAFDESLKARDPRWGIRELDDVAACAASNGLALLDVAEMPANNLSVLFRKIET